MLSRLVRRPIPREQLAWYGLYQTLRCLSKLSASLRCEISCVTGHGNFIAGEMVDVDQTAGGFATGPGARVVDGGRVEQPRRRQLAGWRPRWRRSGPDGVRSKTGRSAAMN